MPKRPAKPKKKTAKKKTAKKKPAAKRKPAKKRTAKPKVVKVKKFKRAKPTKKRKPKPDVRVSGYGHNVLVEGDSVHIHRGPTGFIVTKGKPRTVKYKKGGKKPPWA